MSLAKSVLSGLLAILAKDAGTPVVTALQTFQTSVETTSDVQEVVAAGTQLEASLITAAPSVESALIKDTVALLVPDAIAGITTLQQQAAADAAAAAVKDAAGTNEAPEPEADGQATS